MSVTYYAINRAGLRIRSFDCPDLGRSWVRSESQRRGGLSLIEVETIERRRLICRPRYVEPESFAIPQVFAPQVVVPGPVGFFDKLESSVAAFMRKG